MLKLYNELRRRNVFKVAAAYAVVGWIFSQMANVFFPGLGLPEWVITSVLALVIIGFPIVVFLAWAYEMTPEGLKPTEKVDPSESVTPATGRKIDFIIITGLILALGYFLWSNQLTEETEVPPQINSERE